MLHITASQRGALHITHITLPWVINWITSLHYSWSRRASKPFDSFRIRAVDIATTRMVARRFLLLTDMISPSSRTAFFLSSFFPISFSPLLFFRHDFTFNDRSTVRHIFHIRTKYEKRWRVTRAILCTHEMLLPFFFFFSLFKHRVMW